MDRDSTFKMEKLESIRNEILTIADKLLNKDISKELYDVCKKLIPENNKGYKKGSKKPLRGSDGD